jgi:glycosyltransferase involved in cell wall biosynthesis/pimeloyl-ACP methyl ester carboxylesterase
VAVITMAAKSADIGVVNRSMYLSVGATPVFATAHIPVGTARSTAVLLLPPIGWDEQCSHRVRRQWADGLAHNGYPALRIDLQGTGDSCDCDPDVDLLQAWIDAACGAAAWLREETKCTRVAALGIGFGGLLAWASATQAAPIDDLALWGTPMNGSRLIRQLHASAAVLIDPRMASDNASASEQPSKDRGLEPGDMLDDAGQLMRRATVDAISGLDLAKLPLAHAASRRILLFERAGDERLREHLLQTDAQITVCNGDGFDQLVQYVQFSSLPTGAAEDLLRWLDDADAAPAAPQITASRAPAPTASESVELMYKGIPIRESAVTIEVDGCALRGILTEPSGSPTSELCGVFLSGGSDRRIGHSRTWVDVARRWAALGTPSVRMDPPGVGDSEGDPSNLETLRGQYRDMAFNRTLSMLDGIQTLGVPERLMLAGFCSGGWRGIRAAIADPRVVGVYAMDLPFLRWNWWIVHLRDSWIATREPRPDEAALKQITLRTIKAAMRLARPLRRRLISSPVRSRRNLRTLAQLRAQGTDLTLIYREASEQLEEMIGDITANNRETDVGGITLHVSPGIDPRYRPSPTQDYVKQTLDEAMLRVRHAVTHSDHEKSAAVTFSAPEHAVTDNAGMTTVPKRRLKVLVVASTFPFPSVSGVDMRNAQLLRQIASRHDATLLSYALPEDEPYITEMAGTMSIEVVTRRHTSRSMKRIAQLLSIGSRLPFACLSVRSKAMQRAIDQLTAANRFDLIHIESSTMSLFRFPESIPTVIDEHNIEYELYARLYRGERARLRRLFNGIEFLRMRRFERNSWQHANACTVTSEREQPVISAAAPATPTVVVPNGVDLDYFAPFRGQTTPRTVAFVGVLNYRPNSDAASFLVHEIWPLVLAECPDAKLTILGTAPEREALSLRGPGVEVTGRVPDLRPYLHAASVIAAPIRMGGGTRLKVVEALSLGKAMVSTSLGCEGIAVRDREHLLIADDAASFAARILELFDDAPLRERLGMSGRALAEDRYSWDVAGDRLDALYTQILPEIRSTPEPAAASPERARV